MRQNNKRVPSLYVIKSKISLYAGKGILRHYHSRSDPKLGSVIVAIKIIPCIFHSCITILCLSWYSKTKEAVIQPRYGRVYNCKHSQILGCRNNWIIKIF